MNKKNTKNKDCINAHVIITKLIKIGINITKIQSWDGQQPGPAFAQQIVLASGSEFPLWKLRLKRTLLKSSTNIHEYMMRWDMSILHSLGQPRSIHVLKQKGSPIHIIGFM
jgi:hypothetical protein